MTTNPTTAGEVPPNDPMLTRNEAAALLGVPLTTLVYWAAHRRGPAWVKLGGRYRYRESDVAAFIAASRFDPAT